MTLNFKTLDQEDAAGAPYSHVGVILFGEDGSWHAVRPGTGFERAGQGAPDGLEPGLWVADMDFDRVRALFKGPGSATVRADAWFKLQISQIRTAFGMSGRSGAQAIGVVSAIADRTYRLAQEAVRSRMDQIDYSSERDLNAILEKAASLATGIAKINGRSMLRSGSDEKRVLDHFYKTYQAGMYIGGRKDPGEGHINLSFHFPRMSYAKQITRAEVPASCAIWQQAGRSGDISSMDFFKEASGIRRPAIYMAICQPGPGYVPEHVQAFANGFNSSLSDTYRSRFLEEEIRIIKDYYDLSIESVIVGGSWKTCSTGVLIDGLEEVCGGEAAAAASWSAGLAAENILASALRSVGKESPGKNAEAIWIAARDRAAMMPAIGELAEIGAQLVSANCGNITMRCPLDTELLMLVVGTAWEMGLVLPLESVSTLRQQGIQIPTEHSLFGGKPVDYLLSAIVHRRERNALWSLDGIMDLPISERRKRFHKMISA